MRLGTADVIRADSRNLPLDDNSVDLIVTSPPYFALRSYQDGGEHYAGQIGDEPTPDEFVSSLLEVTAECVRVLKPSGSLWVNLGDKYAGTSSASWVPNVPPKGGGKSDIARRYAPRTQRSGVPAKSLIGIPWRYALRCIDELGLILRAEVIWSKPNGLPESVTDRVRRSHEQWFHFTLEPRYFSAVDEIREQVLHPDWSRPGRSTAPSKEIRPRLGDSSALRNADYSPNPLGKLPGSVWTDTEPGDSLVRSVLSAVAAGALTIKEGERLLWTGTTSSGRRSTKVTPTTVGDGSAPTTATDTDATGRQAKATDARTDSSMKAQSAPSLAASPSTTSAATDGASTPHTSSLSPSKSTSNGDPGQSAARQGTPTTNRTHTFDETASASADAAWQTELESSADAPPSVWVVPTEPLRVPDHLGVDHFAAFPTAWPKRIIEGWSPAGVCVECGEGRRPTARKGAGGKSRADTGDGGRGSRGLPGYADINRSGPWQEGVTRSIVGHECECGTFDLMGVRLPVVTGETAVDPLLATEGAIGASDAVEGGRVGDDQRVTPHASHGPTVEQAPPTRPAVVLDPFGGTGTTAMVAKALGRHGISVDMSADYCRLAEWRTNDRDQLAKVLGIAKAEQQPDDQPDLLGLIDGGAA